MNKLIRAKHPFLHNIADAIREFLRYTNRECAVCGGFVPKHTGMTSVGSFIIMHEECFDRLQKSRIPVELNEYR